MVRNKLLLVCIVVTSTVVLSTALQYVAALSGHCLTVFSFTVTSTDSKKEEDWEAELREELGGFEVVEGGGQSAQGGGKDEQWEEEIQNMIDEEDKSPDLL